MPASELPVAINQAWEARVFTSEHLGKETTGNLLSSLMRSLASCSWENSKLAWRIRQCSHWATEHNPVVWYFLGINGNMPFFQVPMPEFDLSTNDKVQRHKNEILFLNTKMRTGILWEHVLHWIRGKLLLCIPMTTHDFVLQNGIWQGEMGQICTKWHARYLRCEHDTIFCCYLVASTQAPGMNSP